jgi:hypothetical protein
MQRAAGPRRDLVASGGLPRAERRLLRRGRSARVTCIEGSIADRWHDRFELMNRADAGSQFCHRRSYQVELLGERGDIGKSFGSLTWGTAAPWMRTVFVASESPTVPPEWERRLTCHSASGIFDVVLGWNPTHIDELGREKLRRKMPDKVLEVLGNCASTSPHSSMRSIIDGMERILRTGQLMTCAASCTAIIRIGQSEAIIWNVGAHAVFRVRDGRTGLITTDVRNYELGEMGILSRSAASWKYDPEVAPRLLSIFSVGCPPGYEFVRCDIRRGDTLIVADCAGSPLAGTFVPGISFSEFMALESGRSLGMGATMVVLAAESESMHLPLPSAWEARRGV